MMLGEHVGRCLVDEVKSEVYVTGDNGLANPFTRLDVLQPGRRVILSRQCVQMSHCRAEEAGASHLHVHSRDRVDVAQKVCTRPGRRRPVPLVPQILEHQLLWHSWPLPARRKDALPYLLLNPA